MPASPSARRALQALEAVKETREALLGLSADVTLRRWPGRPHTILSEEVDEARSLLASPIRPKR